MKIAVLKLCFWMLLHMTIQSDSYKVACKLFDDKKYEASIKLCSSELTKLRVNDTLFEKFLALRANIYQSMQENGLAIRDYLNLIRIKPNKTMYFTGLSYLYGEIKQYDKSIDVLMRALKLDARDIYVLNNLSYYSSQLYKFEDAINYANEGLKNTNDAEWRGALLNNRGYGYIGLEMYNNALKDINESIKLNPDNSFAYCYRAIANIHLKRMETVCSDLEKAKDLGAVGLTKDLIEQNCKK